MREGLNGALRFVLFRRFFRFLLDITVLDAAPFSFHPSLLRIPIAINILTMALLIRAQFKSLLFHNDYIDDNC